MDSRINFITNLKDCITSRNSMVQQTLPQVSQEIPSQEDVQYLVVRKQIRQSRFFLNANKHIKIRLDKWIDYLDKIKANKIWIKSRNKYIKLLNLMCYCQCMLEPFHALPPEGELPTLRKHEVNKIIDQVELHVKNSSITSKKISRVNEAVDPYNRPSGENTIISQRQQEKKKYQSYFSNEATNNECFFQTLPLKPINNNSKAFRTQGDEKTVSLLNKKAREDNKTQKINLNYFQQTVKTRKQNDICSQQNRLNILSKKNKEPNETNSKNCSPEKKHSQPKLEQTFQKPKVLAKKDKDKENKNTPALPPKIKQKSNETKKPRNLQVDTTPKEYWQSLSNSQVKTPKYLGNFTSQQAVVEEEEVEIVSFREKQEDGCFCTKGDSWLARLFKKQVSQQATK